MLGGALRMKRLAPEQLEFLSLSRRRASGTAPIRSSEVLHAFLNTCARSKNNGAGTAA
jgi:hypothetical protein